MLPPAAMGPKREKGFGADTLAKAVACATAVQGAARRMRRLSRSTGPSAVLGKTVNRYAPQNENFVLVLQRASQGRPSWSPRAGTSGAPTRDIQGGALS